MGPTFIRIIQLSKFAGTNFRDCGKKNGTYVNLTLSSITLNLTNPDSRNQFDKTRDVSVDEQAKQNSASEEDR